MADFWPAPTCRQSRRHNIESRMNRGRNFRSDEMIQRMIRRNCAGHLMVLCALLLYPSWAGAQTSAKPEILVIDGSAPAHPFPHFWEHMFGSGRASLSMRESYRQDLRSVKQITAVEYIRFHAIFLDEMGVYDEDSAGHPVYNFSYVDQAYDGLLQNGVRPFVELSFMPKKLASKDALHAFWYKQNVAPPKDWAKWDDLIYQFTKHLADRYGIDEVAHWYFEVWNEPNIDFWVGNPKQATYFELYDHTVRAIKKVSPRISVGAPSTAQAAWVTPFLEHCRQNNVPVDFVSTHVYANDTAKDVFGTSEQIPRNQMVCRSVKKVHDEIGASAFPQMPLIFSEYNASYANEPDVTDTIYMGPWLAGTISQCDGLTEAMSYWTFSDVFEEQGVVRTPFYGGFGLIAEDGIPKPAFNAFAMLHQLGDRRLKAASDAALATRRSDGTIVVALWNYAPPFGTGATYTPPPQGSGPEKRFMVKLNCVSPKASVEILRLDAEHGNVMQAYDAMGRPAFPTRDQIVQLRAAGKASPPQKTVLKEGSLSISIPPQGLVLITVPNHAAAR